MKQFEYCANSETDISYTVNEAVRILC